ncbi:hypothetical protein WICPIJ_001545 [Wickerhamomyces pijperi]|uniref:Exonuclease domain-containing protein n=1 Tax=Wickerhamomyces pijperi TaxID=599730 RepID=A0A9P8QBE5_WICPI|nr:hypothetical protein WICPIJ_001545 [Wickerhamomyces pijperi]
MFKDLKINRDTVTAGHGLENDLCASRLIHHRDVADTAIIFVKVAGAGARNKYALKDLASMYLRRSIQNGAHSGGEDAKVFADLI